MYKKNRLKNEKYTILKFYIFIILNSYIIYLLFTILYCLSPTSKSLYLVNHNHTTVVNFGLKIVRANITTLVQEIYSKTV